MLCKTIKKILYTVLIFCFVSCTPKQEEREKRLIVGDFFDITPSSPLDFPPRGIFSAAMELIFEGLNYVDKKSEISNRIAREISAKEGKNFKIKIVKDAYFSDGTLLTSNDVIFTIETCLAIENNRSCRMFDSIEEIKTNGKFEIDIRLKKVFATFPKYFEFMGILPKHIFPKEKYDRDVLLKNPVGSGPYKVESFLEDELVLSTNQYYRLEKPDIDKIIFKKIEDKHKAWALLVGKKIDMVLYPTEAELEMVSDIPHIKTYNYFYPFNYFILFNNKRSIFKDVRVKKAINLAVDRDKMVKQILNGNGRPSLGIFPPESSYSESSTNRLKYDPSMAEKLLKESGWKDSDRDGILELRGKELTLRIYYIREYPELLDTMLFVKNELLKIGVKVIIEDIGFLSFINEHLIKGDFDSVLYPLPVMGDPDFLYNSLHSSKSKKSFNWSNYSNREVDKLFEMGRSETESKKREMIYKRLEKELRKDPPGLYLYWKRMGVLVNERFTNIDENSTSVFLDIPNWKVN